MIELFKTTRASIKFDRMIPSGSSWLMGIIHRVICKHRDGSMARETWDVKIVPQLNHDLFSFTKAIKEGWQMNWRWKEGVL